METFTAKALVAPSVVATTAASMVGALAGVELLLLAFGSCPTVYADTGTGPVLQAEGFSYAIAPLLEQRDLDPLRVRPDRNGIIRLELRNEALETHFINNIELVAVSHVGGSLVLPDQHNALTVVSGIRPLASAHDRVGRNVLTALAAVDGDVYSSASKTMDGAHVGDLDDWIDLDAHDLPPGDSIAVVLRLRNSLLNTVLLYDGMLGGRDAADWMENGLQHISAAIDLSKWYERTMGMRASVGGVAPLSNEQPWSARLSDVGPIAFRDVAIVLPRSATNARTVRVRLKFAADDWRIDYAAVAGTVVRPASTVIPLERVVVPAPRGGGAPIADTAALGALRETDGQYLETLPGQRLSLEFTVPQMIGAAGPDTATTYMLAWQGYYREWIRGHWLAEPTRTGPWVPGDASMLTALTQWRSRQAEFERAFYSTRIPVR